MKRTKEKSLSNFFVKILHLVHEALNDVAGFVAMGTFALYLKHRYGGFVYVPFGILALTSIIYHITFDLDKKVKR